MATVMDTTAASAVLKTMFIGPVREQINTKTILLKYIEREDQEVGGKNFTIPLHTGYNENSGLGRAEGSDLPDASTQVYTTITVPIKRLYGRIKVSGSVMKASRSNAYAFVKAVDSETKGAVKNFRRSMNRQLLSDGRDILAKFRSNVSDSTSATFSDGKDHPFVHYQSGQKVDVYAAAATSASSALYSGLTITHTGEAATHKTATLSSAVTVSAGDIVVPYGTWNESLMGLQGIIDDINPVILGSAGLHGLPVASNDFWKARVSRGATPGTLEALTLARLQAPLSLLDFNATDFDSNDIPFILWNVFVRDKYVALLTAQKRFVNSLELDGGFKGIEFNGIGGVVEPQMPRNEVFYPCIDALKIVRMSDIDWMDADGSVLKQVPNKDEYQAFLYQYADLCTTVRSAHARLVDITD